MTVAMTAGVAAGLTPPAMWRGEPADAYGRWAARQRDALAELDAALDRAALEISSGGERLAERLAMIDLPVAILLGTPTTADEAPPLGVAAQRDRDNRARLVRDLEALREIPRRTLEQNRQLATLEVIERRLAELDLTTDPITGAPVVVQLHEYEPSAFAGDGIVVVAIGDLDTAENVGVIVPGMGTTAVSIGNVTGSALRLRDAARRADPGARTAAVAWIGYDAPSGPISLLEAVTQRAAREGAAQLREDLVQISSARRENPPRLVVFGHSYGSTTAARAAAGGALSSVVDSMVLLGSPGVGPVRTAADFDLAGGVYVARDPGDPVPSVSLTDRLARGLSRALGGQIGLGADPASAEFGATVLPIDSPSRPGAGAHSGYFDEGTQSLTAFAQILTGGARGG